MQAEPGYEELSPFFGDLHNHCDISYGHGTLDEAYRNARMQLDFVSVTAHAHWPDLPEADDRLASVNAYHREGFQRALQQWPRYRAMTNEINTDGEFVSLLSFEWHSMQSGDHNVYYKGDHGEIITANDLEAMRSRLRGLSAHGVSSLLIPHHIGYSRGYRGINWAEFTPEFSPFVEIFSMHGSAESDDAPYPYLHTMGPRDSRSTMQRGLAEGHVFGVVGSTDSHSAHPGSYGAGRLGVWATELTRDGIWEALTSRRTWALTGDNIEVMLSLNGHPMGAVLPHAADRDIRVSVCGGNAIDYVEVLHNNRIAQRWNGYCRQASDASFQAKVDLELGWGELDDAVDWQVDLHVDNGRLLTVEPRFRGRDIVSPQQQADAIFATSTLQPVAANHIRFSTRSWRNPTTVSPATQGVSLELQGDLGTVIRGTINDQPVSVTLGELTQGARTGHLGGFLTPAYVFHRAVREGEYALQDGFVHRGTEERDWYYVRVRQHNGQWAWSSPIWVDHA